MVSNLASSLKKKLISGEVWSVRRGRNSTRRSNWLQTCNQSTYQRLAPRDQDQPASRVLTPEAYSGSFKQLNFIKYQMLRNSHSANSPQAQLKHRQLAQRTELSKLVLNKLTQDFGDDNPLKKIRIANLVEKYFATQKVTEASLKALKGAVQEQVSRVKRSSSQAAIALPVMRQSRTDQPVVAQSTSEARPVSSAAKSSKLSRRSSLTSSSSASRRQSVYGMEEGCEEDEWAALVRYDTEMFLKQKELFRLRDLEEKKRTRLQLDAQVGFKKKRVELAKLAAQQQQEILVQQLQSYDQREAMREREAQRKVMLEKAMRDRQVKEARRNRRREQRKQQEMEQKLLHKIRADLQADENEVRRRRQQENQRIKELIAENQRNQQRLAEEARRQREEEIAQQQLYGLKSKQMEQKREEERRQLEDKVRHLLNQNMKLVKEQEDLLRDEDMRLRKHFEEMQRREVEEERAAQAKNRRAKEQVYATLDRQMEEKRAKAEVEESANKQQADLWRIDNERFSAFEKEKSSYMRSVNVRHQEALLLQMAEKQKKACSHMNCMEKLLNKVKMKQAMQNDSRIRPSLIRLAE